MHFHPEFTWNCFNKNPIPYNFAKGSRLLIPPAKSVNFGRNSFTLVLWNNVPLRSKNIQLIKPFFKVNCQELYANKKVQELHLESLEFDTQETLF